MARATKPTREWQIDGRRIVVFDGLVRRAAVVALEKELRTARFQRLEHADPERAEYRHWSVRLTDVGSRLCDPLVRAGGREVERHFGAISGLHRAYCNFASYGDMLVAHRDCDLGAGRVTAIWYIADRWELDWGGETLFYDENGDAVFVVSPKPGRVVLFDGSILHVGRPPNRICYEPRFSVAIKYSLVKSEP